MRRCRAVGATITRFIFLVPLKIQFALFPVKVLGIKGSARLDRWLSGTRISG